MHQVEQKTGKTKRIVPAGSQACPVVVARYLIHTFKDGTEIMMAGCFALVQSRRRNSHWQRPRGNLARSGKPHCGLVEVVTTPDGVHKVNGETQFSVTLRERAELAATIRAVPWMPGVSAEGFGEQTTEFVLPSLLTVTGKIRPRPGLTKAYEAVKQDSEETHAEALQDLPRESVEIAEHSSASAGVKHGIDEPEPSGFVARPPKALRPDPDLRVAGSSPKAQRIASIVGWIAAAVGIGSARTKDGLDVPWKPELRQ